MSDIESELKRFKVFTKIDGEGNQPAQYSDEAKDAIVNQYNDLVKVIGITKTQASKALAKLHFVHHSTIRKWNKNPKYNQGREDYFKPLAYLSTEDIKFRDESKSVPAYASIPKSVETSTAMDKLVNALLKIKSITLTLKFNKT